MRAVYMKKVAWFLCTKIREIAWGKKIRELTHSGDSVVLHSSRRDPPTRCLAVKWERMNRMINKLVYFYHQQVGYEKSLESTVLRVGVVHCEKNLCPAYIIYKFRLKATQTWSRARYLQYCFFDEVIFSGSGYHQAKIVRKTLFWNFLIIFYLW
jgi:hypothetical protein